MIYMQYIMRNMKIGMVYLCHPFFLVKFMDSLWLCIHQAFRSCRVDNWILIELFFLTL